MEKNMLEAARDNGGFSTVQPNSNPPSGGGITSSKNKPKGVFTTFDHSDPESDDEIATGVHVAAGHSDWIKPGSKHMFPCPLQSHGHEIAACSEFLTLTTEGGKIWLTPVPLQSYFCLLPPIIRRPFFGECQPAALRFLAGSRVGPECSALPVDARGSPLVEQLSREGASMRYAPLFRRAKAQTKGNLVLRLALP